LITIAEQTTAQITHENTIINGVPTTIITRKEAKVAITATTTEKETVTCVSYISLLKNLQQLILLFYAWI